MRPKIKHLGPAVAVAVTAALVAVPAAGARADTTVTVGLATSTLTVSAPSNVLIGTRYTVRGNLALSVGAPSAGTAVKITRAKRGTTTMHWTRQTAADGTFTLSNKPPAWGTYTYTATYAGSTTTQPATVTRTVTVRRLPVSLRITTSRNKIPYKAKVKITAHLGTTHTNRTVAIYARTVGGEKKVLLKRGHVNSHGNLVLWYRAPHSKVFTAVFTGDTRYRPRTASHTVGVRAKVMAKPAGYYMTISIAGRGYHMYHHSGKLREAVTVTPNKHGQCVQLQVQEFQRRAWRTKVVTNCAYLDQHSKISGYLSLINMDWTTTTKIQGPYFRYRIRADYARKSSDRSNLNAAGSWFYFAVRN